MELTGYIANLLQKHDCVIVPKFGGFIANYQSATIDTINGRIQPPSKQLLFNPNLLNNDGLLGNAIATAQEISYPNALDFIDVNVANWKSELNAGNRIEIGEIGFLFNLNGQITFEQNREVNLLLSAYGLSSIQFVDLSTQIEKSEVKTLTVHPASIDNVVEPVQVKQPEVIRLNPTFQIEKEVVSKDEIDETPVVELEQRKSNVLKYLAVAAAIPLMFYSYWIPMQTDFIETGKIQIADFNPIQSPPARNYEMRIEGFESNSTVETKTWEDLTGHLSENVNVYNYQFDDELYIPIKLDKTATKFDANSKKEELSTKETSDLVYHVISGCFSVKSNADQLVIDLNKEGYNARILDLKGGLYRVTSGDFSNRTTAKQKLKDFKESGYSGWILKK